MSQKNLLFKIPARDIKKFNNQNRGFIMSRTIQMMMACAFMFSTIGFLGADCGCNQNQNQAIQTRGNSEWESLRTGNKKYVNSPKYARQRAPFVHHQDFNAIVLSCADSRVTPEFIFSQKIGDLFVVRSAGQVIDNVVIDSLEFAVRRYNATVLLIMGHTDCGAVKGALDRLIMNGGVVDEENGHLLAVLIPIEKAIVASGMDIYAPDAFEKAIRVNIRYIAEQLVKKSEPIAEAVASKKIALIGAEYHLKSGKVKELFKIKIE